MSALLDKTNSKIQVNIGEINSLNKDALTNVGNSASISIQVNHNNQIKNENLVAKTSIEQTTNVTINQSIPQVYDATQAQINSGYNALSKNNNTGQLYESYKNGELIELNPTFETQLRNSNNNYNILFTLIFDNLKQPIPLKLHLFIPKLITNLFSNNTAYKIINNSSVLIIRELEGIDMQLYQNSLNDNIILNTII